MAGEIRGKKNRTPEESGFLANNDVFSGVTVKDRCLRNRAKFSDFDFAHADTNESADDAGNCRESHEPANHEKYAVHLPVPL